MGLGNSSIKFCCAAKSLGVDFRKTLMLGRQKLWPELNALQRVFAIQEIASDAAEFLEANKYGEEFFSVLGAKEIESLDYSEYEGATIIHDMNSEVPENLKERYSVVYDGGTLEHVFNVPQALKNSMEMVEIGGHFLQANIANNLMGHGFWQFSPELLFRVFSPENGFKIEAVLLHENVTGGRWYSVKDPDQVHQRVELCNNMPTYIFTMAKRVSNVDVFSNPPLQSDYSRVWDNTTRERASTALESHASNYITSQVSRKNLGFNRVFKESLKRIFRPLRNGIRQVKEADPFEKCYYRLLKEDQLLRGLLE